jgi:iron complex outermembrane receptor protein
MMVETVLSRSVRLICASGLALGMHAAVAQTADAPIQRVEITGSSIKRITAEGALPVQTLSKLQIEQSGASNVADLIATLPSMQGFTTSSMSVNGGGGGLQTASIHAIGEGYTLVLLNGRRLAPSTSGSTVNLASIPLAAVERVEILTDGANTLYGSDAIAGVVNFILKKNQQTPSSKPPTASHAAAAPPRPPRSPKAGATWKRRLQPAAVGFARRKQGFVGARRDFSEVGVIPFWDNGKAYSLYQLSSNSIPGVATVKYQSRRHSKPAFGPNLFATGACNGANLFKVGNRCLFDYAATVQHPWPETRQRLRLAEPEDQRQPTSSPKAGLVVQQHRTIRPAGTAAGHSTVERALQIHPALPDAPGRPSPTAVNSVTMNLRLVDAGGRADEYKTIAKHLAFGVDGTFNNIDWRAAYTHSENKQTDTAAGGYMSLNAFDALVSAGKFDPFAPPGTSKDVLAPAVLHNQFSETKSKIDMLQASGSTEVFKLPPAAQLALGADFTQQKYSKHRMPSRKARTSSSLTSPTRLWAAAPAPCRSTLPAKTGVPTASCCCQC